MRRRLLGFARSEEGSATLEFVIWFPLFWALFMWSFEQGMYLVRQIALDRGLDLTVRDLRLGAFDELIDPKLSSLQQTLVLHTAVKERVCQLAPLIPDCPSQVKLEMRVIDPRNWSMLGNDVDCVDGADPGRPAIEFMPGQSNDLMVIRACALFDPYFPTSGLGARLEKVSTGSYALVSIATFAIEPKENG